MDLVPQISLDNRHKQSSIPRALIKEKETKQEPIQKVQTRQKQE